MSLRLHGIQYVNFAGGQHLEPPCLPQSGYGGAMIYPLLVPLLQLISSYKQWIYVSISEHRQALCSQHWHKSDIPASQVIAARQQLVDLCQCWEQNQ
jgi:hypothetical protein